MTVTIACEQCGAQYRVAEKSAPWKAKCKKCGAVMSVPAAGRVAQDLMAVAVPNTPPPAMPQVQQHAQKPPTKAAAVVVPPVREDRRAVTASPAVTAKRPIQSALSKRFAVPLWVRASVIILFLCIGGVLLWGQLRCSNLHRQDLLAIKKQADALTNAGKQQEAMIKYRILLERVTAEDLQDASLQNEFKAAQEALDKINMAIANTYSSTKPVSLSSSVHDKAVYMRKTYGATSWSDSALANDYDARVRREAEDRQAEADNRRVADEADRSRIKDKADLMRDRGFTGTDHDLANTYDRAKSIDNAREAREERLSR